MHYLETNIFQAVVRNIERGYGEIAQAEFFAYCQHPDIRLVNLLPDAIVPANAFMHFLRGIHRYPVSIADKAYGFHMVRMVVRHKDTLYVAQTQAIVRKIFFQFPYADACVYQYSKFTSKYIIAISATSAAERYEIQHLLTFWLQKYKEMGRGQKKLIPL